MIATPRRRWIFFYEPFDFASALGNAKWDWVGDTVQAPFVPLEQLLAMKKSAGRPQDLQDIQALEEVQRLRP